MINIWHLTKKKPFTRVVYQKKKIRYYVLISRTEITELIIIFLINLQNVGSQIAAQLLQKLLDIYDLWDLKQIAEKACRYIYEVGLKKER